MDVSIPSTLADAIRYAVPESDALRQARKGVESGVCPTCSGPATVEKITVTRDGRQTEQVWTRCKTSRGTPPKLLQRSWGTNKLPPCPLHKEEISEMPKHNPLPRFTDEEVYRIWETIHAARDASGQSLKDWLADFGFPGTRIYGLLHKEAGKREPVSETSRIKLIGLLNADLVAPGPAVVQADPHPQNWGSPSVPQVVTEAIKGNAIRESAEFYQPIVDDLEAKLKEARDTIEASKEGDTASKEAAIRAAYLRGKEEGVKDRDLCQKNGRLFAEAKFMHVLERGWQGDPLTAPDWVKELESKLTEARESGVKSVKATPEIWASVTGDCPAYVTAPDAPLSVWELGRQIEPHLAKLIHEHGYQAAKRLCKLSYDIAAVAATKLQK
jgi:hypothetical protein